MLGAKTKTLTDIVPEGYTCPTAVSKENWENTWKRFLHKFEITQTGRTLKVPTLSLGCMGNGLQAVGRHASARWSVD